MRLRAKAAKKAWLPTPKARVPVAFGLAIDDHSNRDDRKAQSLLNKLAKEAAFAADLARWGLGSDQLGPRMGRAEEYARRVYDPKHRWTYRDARAHFAPRKRKTYTVASMPPSRRRTKAELQGVERYEPTPSNRWGKIKAKRKNKRIYIRQKKPALSMVPRHILLLPLWLAVAEAANNTTLAPTTLAPTTTPAPTSSRHHPEACQERCYPEEGQNYDEDCCALRDRMSCLGNYTLIQLGYVCASGDGWKAHAYECVPCAGPACDNGPGDDARECDDHGMWWLWVIFLPMFVMIISIVCGICCCLHFQARRHAWEDQFADRPIMLTHRPCVEMRHVPVAEAFVPPEAFVAPEGEARPGDAASVPTAAAVEYPLPPLPPAYQAPPR